MRFAGIVTGAQGGRKQEKYSRKSDPSEPSPRVRFLSKTLSSAAFLIETTRAAE